MILEALYRLAQQEELMADPDFEVRPVAWLVRVDEAGKLVGIQGTHVEEPGLGRRNPRRVPKPMRIPRRRPGKTGTRAPPDFLVDNAKYTFGLGTPDKAVPAQQGVEKSGWYREVVADCAAETGDAGVVAVQRLLDRIADGRQVIALPREAKSNDLFAFIYDPDQDGCVHDRPAVAAYWRRLRPTWSERGDASGRCLVTGREFAGAPLFPVTKKIPNAQSSGAYLVSFNQRAFESYGWTGNANASISTPAGEACATALQRLVDPSFRRAGRPDEPAPRRQLQITSDSVVCFWAETAGVSDDFLDVFAEVMEGTHPERVGEVYRSLWRGRPITLDRPERFFALTLSGAQARIVVRDWFESTVGQVATNLGRHFADLLVVRNTPRPKDGFLAEHVPLPKLVAALAPIGKASDVPPALAAALVRAALQGDTYPIGVLQRALERTRAEIGRGSWADLERRDARTSLVKGVLIRSYQMEVTPEMDPTNAQPGYLLGRLMAVLERLQQAAMGDDLNAGVVDRYFGAASATPRVVFPRLLKGARYHVRKAKDEPRTSNTAAWLDRQLDEIVSKVEPGGGFPPHLPLEQQGLFVLGYHQQRHWLWLPREQREARGPEAEATKPSAA